MTHLAYCLLKECDFVSKEGIFSCFHQGQCPLFLFWNSTERAPSGDSWELSFEFRKWDELVVSRQGGEQTFVYDVR